jgi:hypothetical protein
MTLDNSDGSDLHHPQIFGISDSHAAHTSSFMQPWVKSSNYITARGGGVSHSNTSGAYYKVGPIRSIIVGGYAIIVASN